MQIMYKYQFEKLTLITDFVLQGHICPKMYFTYTMIHKLDVLIYELLLDFIYLLTSYGNIFHKRDYKYF